MQFYAGLTHKLDGWKDTHKGREAARQKEWHADFKPCDSCSVSASYRLLMLASLDSRRLFMRTMMGGAAAAPSPSLLASDVDARAPHGACSVVHACGTCMRYMHAVHAWAPCAHATAAGPAGSAPMRCMLAPAADIAAACPCGSQAAAGPPCTGAAARVHVHAAAAAAMRPASPATARVIATVQADRGMCCRARESAAAPMRHALRVGVGAWVVDPAIGMLPRGECFILGPYPHVLLHAVRTRRHRLGVSRKLPPRIP
eukprot:354859-Chlamydomonas_euryale.AAC.13